MTEKALESKLVGRVTGSINGGCVQPLASPRIELRQTDNTQEDMQLRGYSSSV